MSVADALAAPSLQMSALHPAVTLPGSTRTDKRGIDWSLDFKILRRVVLITAASWLMGRAGLSVLWVVLLSLLLVFSVVRQRKRVQLFQTLKFQRLMHEPAALQQALPLIPAWISFPDLEKADFIATLVRQMWPQLKVASEAVVMQIVPPIMNKLKPPPLTALTIVKLDLGNIPPSIPGLRLQSQSSEEGEVMLDIEVEFAGNPNIVVEARSGPAPVHVSIGDFFFRSTIRAVLKPLLYELPCFGAVSVSFVTRPEINFKLSTVGVSVMAIPGLNELLYDLIKSQITALVVWPKKIVVPIKKLSAEVMAQLNTAECQGVLRVRVRGARDIKPGETYAKVSLGRQKKKTETHKHHGSVEWRDEFEFLVHDADNDELCVELKSKEGVLLNAINTVVIDRVRTNKSTALGDISVPVNRFTAEPKANTLQDMWMTLHHQHKGRTGQVHLEITWSPFRRSEEEEQALDAVKGATQPELLRRRSTRSRLPGSGSGTGLVIVSVHSAAGLKKPSGHVPHSPYVVLTLGSATCKTSHASGGSDCKWEQQFEMSVQDVATASLHLEIRDRPSHASFSLGFGKDTVIGDVVIPCARMQRDGRKTETLPLQKTATGTVTISTELKET